MNQKEYVTEYIDLAEKYKSHKPKEKKVKKEDSVDENILATRACIESIKDIMKRLSHND